jgi:hypothetical protein
MPGTLWSAPMENMGIVSNSTAVAAALTDYSPAEVVIPPFTLNLGTRIRLRAYGNYVASAATATPTWGFYLTNAGTTFSTSSLALAVTGAVTLANVSSASLEWALEWDGHVRALSTTVAATAVYFGTGKFWNPGASVAAAYAAPLPIPITAALRTVTQVANGGNTNQGQLVSVGIFPNVTTALTSITCDELTCELLG